MNKHISWKAGWLAAAMLLWAAPSQAQDLMDWLQDAVEPVEHGESVAAGVLDRARLLTLEPRETEMYPQVSPDGKELLVISGKSRKQVVSRRVLENGDTINVVIDSDPLSFGSIRWYGNNIVTFLSTRADSLGLWQKSASGGVVRRHLRLEGDLRTPVVLDDGSVIAVRLHNKSRRIPSASRYNSHHRFDNWEYRGKDPHLVLIAHNGAERELTAGVNPSLSPDGRRVVFSMQDGKRWHLFMMSVDGTDLIQLTEGEHIDVQPTWSRDGRWIAFTSNRDGAVEQGLHVSHHGSKKNWDIWLIGHDGRGLTRLTHDKASDGAPSIADNGRVYFHSDRKVSKADRKRMQVNGSPKGFHIWSVELPAKVS